MIVVQTTDHILPPIDDYLLAYNIAPDVTNRHQTPVIGDRLTDALNTAIAAREQIAREQLVLRELLQTEDDATRRAGRQYQIDLVEWQLTRAAELAEKRLAYLQTITTPDAVKRELELCRDDPRHWCDNYAWGFDPRPDSPLNVVPFGLFEFQTRYWSWLDHLVFKTRQSGVAPKSRDMGATELFLRWSLHGWLFRDQFEVLLLSRTEDEVDSKKDVNTLFEKARFQLRLLPEWMLPEGFDLNRDMPYMMIQNPQTRSTLHGRAPTENVGRQLRVTVVGYDEAPFAPNGGYKQHTSLSQTTKSQIWFGSVAGRLNKFADMMTDGKTPQFIMDWREHPWKTPEWYNALPTGVFGSAMTAQQIAQEIDRDLDASQPGKVWKFREEYTFITWGELAAAYERYGMGSRFTALDPAGRPITDHAGNPVYRIPDDWKWSRYHDYGQTQGHEWGYAVTAKPSEYYAWSDTIFVFLALELKPTGLTTEQAVRLWTDYERELGLRDLSGRIMRTPANAKNSHEQLNLRKELLEEYGEDWGPWDTDYISGIETIQKWFNVIDHNQPNPFRPQLNGRCRVVFVAPNSEYQPAFDERNGAWFVTNSKTERGFMTLRKQLAAYHYPEEERGKDVKKMRPAKQFDDIIDPLRAAALDDEKPERRTRQQEIQRRLTPEHQSAAVAAHYGQPGYAQLLLDAILESRQHEIAIVEELREEQRRVIQMIGAGRRARLLGGRRRR